MVVHVGLLLPRRPSHCEPAQESRQSTAPRQSWRPEDPEDPEDRCRCEYCRTYLHRVAG